MSIVDKFMNLDRRIIYLVIGLTVVIPMFIPIGMPIKITPEVQNVFNRMEALQPGDVVHFSLDYGPSTQAELEPLTYAMLRHAFSRQVKVIITALQLDGVGLIESEMKMIAEEFNQKYGEDYVFLGYKPYPGVIIMHMGESYAAPFPADHYNTPLGKLPLMQRVKNYKDIKFVMTINSTSGVDQWIIYGRERYNVELAIGVTAVMAAEYYNYLNAGQIFGIIGGLKGSAEYEILVNEKKLPVESKIAIRGMDVQSIAHIVIIIFILLSNIGFVIQKRRK